MHVKSLNNYHASVFPGSKLKHWANSSLLASCGVFSSGSTLQEMTVDF